MNEAIKKGIVVGIGVILQISISLLFNLYLMEKLWIVNAFYAFLRVLLVLGLIKYSKHYSYTLPWLVILLLFPLVGTLLYVILGNNKNKSSVLKKIVKSEKDAFKYLVQEGSVYEEFKDNGRLRYISDFAGYPITKNNLISYYPLGEEAFLEMLKELEEAKKFIFIEYFIISKGVMWEKILNILIEKVKQNVEVRIMYDDAGCISTLPHNYKDYLESLGMKCVVFNKLHPISGVIMNNRDHRKILIIDGKIAFSGGINISDEYINVGSPYGHWKDNGIKVKGPAVWNYTVMFLALWNAFSKEDDDFTKFYNSDFKEECPGYVAAFGETPLDDEVTGEDIYMNIINQSHDYVYIFTPYLIIDSEMINALSLAAKRGVDVRIVIPGIPDKKLVYTLSLSYVEILVAAGVKIYKYTPGFVHAKVFVSDDTVATVGTINLDYRSLYLHFECGLYMENVDVIKDIKRDLLETTNKSHEVKKEEATPGFWKSIWQAILRLFAPLM